MDKKIIDIKIVETFSDISENNKKWTCTSITGVELIPFNGVTLRQAFSAGMMSSNILDIKPGLSLIGGIKRDGKHLNFSSWCPVSEDFTLPDENTLTPIVKDKLEGLR
jgi:hypothetical protein